MKLEIEIEYSLNYNKITGYKLLKLKITTNLEFTLTTANLH